MGFRFRKSIRVGKGFRINLSKSGIGWSAYIPGTGIGYGYSPRRRQSSGCGLVALLALGGWIYVAAHLGIFAGSLAILAGIGVWTWMSRPKRRAVQDDDEEEAEESPAREFADRAIAGPVPTLVGLGLAVVAVMMWGGMWIAINRSHSPKPAPESVVAAPPPLPSDPQAKGALESAKSARFNGQEPAAIYMLRKLIKAHPGTAEAVEAEKQLAEMRAKP